MAVGRDCKPFEHTFEEQIKLVTDFSWKDMYALDALRPEVEDILSQSPHISGERRRVITDVFGSRLDVLCRHL